jgi:hypothetical protein
MLPELSCIERPPPKRKIARWNRAGSTTFPRHNSEVAKTRQAPISKVRQVPISEYAFRLWQLHDILELGTLEGRR